MTIHPRVRAFADRWCLPCVAVGSGLLILLIGTLATTATASTTTAAPVQAIFTARDVILGLVGLVLSIGGAYLAGMRGRISGLEVAATAAMREVNDLRELVYRDYLNKSDINDRFESLERHISEGFGSINRRLDSLNVAPPSRN